MIDEKIKELGWSYDSIWNNRSIYKLNKESEYPIFEHNGEWGIVTPYISECSLIYCDLSTEELEQYTELVKTIEEIIEKPKDYTFYDFCMLFENVKDFINKMRER